MSECNIAITGSTGWFGKSFIKKYVEKKGLESAIKHLFLFSSDGRKLKIPSIDHDFDTFPLSNLNQQKNIDAFIHSAFLTKDKISIFGEKEFVRINTEISDTACSFIENRAPEKVYLISSGAATDSNCDKDLYGRLKRREESLFWNVGCKSLKVFRVFGASGCLTPNVEWSALSSFINSAKHQRNIDIMARGVVKRSYVSFDALSELILSLISSSLIPSSEIIDACSIETDIYTLAKIVSNNSNSEVNFNENYDPQVIQNQYVGSNERFIELCKAHSVHIATLEEKVAESFRSPYF